MKAVIIRTVTRVAMCAMWTAVLSQAAHAQQSIPSGPESSINPPIAENHEEMDFIREDEAKAKAMAASNGLVIRNNDTLTVFYNGASVASFTDYNKFSCFGADPCERWYFLGTLPLQFPNGRLEFHAVVGYDPGEAPKFLIIDQAGTPVWFDGNLSASPDGRFVADGSQSSVYTGPHLQIIDWTSQGHSSGYKVEGLACDPMTWLDSNTVTLRCEQFAAKATHSSNGAWEIVETGIFDRNMQYHEKTVKHPRRYKMTAFTYNGTASTYTSATIRGLKILTQP